MGKVQLPDDVVRAYDAAVVIIQDIQSEADEISFKFGTSSKLFKRKQAQVDGLKAFYKDSSMFINSINSLARLLQTNYVAMQVILFQKETGMPFNKVCDVLKVPMSEEQIISVTAADKIISDLRELITGVQA